MEALLDSLNTAQKEAAQIIDQDVRIVAGAGSGKTRVLMARIEYLINVIGILPFRIMAITFTNKAAAQMKERLAKQIGEEEARRVRISTIHSLAARMLREDYEAAGLEKNFLILDSDDQKALLRPFFKENGITKDDFTPGNALGCISDWKMAGVSCRQALEDAAHPADRLLAEAYDFYEKAKSRIQAADFDDLLLWSARLLEEDETVRTKWQNRLDYIHVDEFQDVDPVQYSMIKNLRGPETRLCVVGDPDQTIYTWRGASVDIILNFDRDFPECKTVILGQNYRSTKNILNAANAVIRNNISRIEKDLFSEIEGSHPIIVRGFPDSDEEARFAARQIVELHEKGLPYSEIAILYRSNFLSRTFEKTLRLTGIPYKIYGSIRFYERQEIKDILSYLHLLTHPDPENPHSKALNLAVERVINQPKRGIGSRSVEKVIQAARARNLNELEVMKEDIGLTAAAAKKVRGFYEMIEELRHERERNNISDLIDIILARTGYREMIENSHEAERLENIKELQNDLTRAFREDPQMTLESYLQDISLFTERKGEESAQDADAVTLMTIHAAKGTEFQAVFLAGMEEGIFPNQRSVDEGGRESMEEERRLLYVAMTRAREYLYILYNTGFSFISQKSLNRSPFLDEIPEEYCQSKTEKRPNVRPAVKKPVRPGRRTRTRMVHMHPGDLVVHDTWGEGVVISVEGDIASIAFAVSVGVKKIKITHPSLKKMGS